MRKQPLKHNSILKDLNVFLDENGLLRVGGWLKYSNLTYDQRHTIVLPTKHRITELIILESHTRLLHAGTQAVLYDIRNQFWPIAGKQAVRRVLYKCVTCFRNRPKRTNQLMGNLPPSHVTPSRAFLKSGVDYAGPFNIKVSRNVSSKAYLCVFICLATKATHLELVSDLTTHAFLNALRRFVSRRGKPSDIYSDNGTNFVGANKELKLFFEFLKKVDHQPIIKEFALKQSIIWHFIPPHSPHFDGVWEAAVKSAKTHMRKIIGNALLSFEALATVFTMIEACINSRPLSSILNDPSDLQPLTPGHFLIGEPLSCIPEADVSDKPANRLSQYQRLLQLQQHFWDRWSREYLNQLQSRTKWKTRQPNLIAPGTMVILKDEVLPPLQWKLGRVTEVFPDKDNVIRVVNVKTSTGILKRSIQKLCILLIDDSC